MKKCIALLLLLCLMPLQGLAAPNFESIDAVVANRKLSDRLILRDRPSEKGKELGKQIADKVDGVLFEMDDDLTENERENLYRCLSIISDSLDSLAT